MDVDSDESVGDGLAGVLARHGRVDAVVVSAGWGVAGAVEHTAIDEARAQLETNFWGATRVVQGVLPAMRAQGGGRMVLISSIGGVVAIPFQAFYSASKFALEGLGEALAYEVAPFGITVTLVEPETSAPTSPPTGKWPPPRWATTSTGTRSTPQWASWSATK
jgi:NAD(P)-dependent dehydrogenase (short-subunit alcohol dehydrogenase family)